MTLVALFCFFINGWPAWYMAHKLSLFDYFSPRCDHDVSDTPLIGSSFGCVLCCFVFFGCLWFAFAVFVLIFGLVFLLVISGTASHDF